jgi:AcrR family transcriptional regulator
VKESARRRSRERLEERERIILDAATQQFASAGFHATSTRRIAAAAGVSEGTVFHYFGSKMDLMLTILDRFYEGVLNRHAATILDSVMGTRERLQALALHHARSLAADNALMMRLLQVYVGVDLEFIGAKRDSPLRSLNRRYVGHLDRILREGMERGDLRSDLDIHAFRDVFFGSLEYGLRTHLYRHGEQGLDDWIATLLEPLWHGIRARDDVDGHGTADLDRLADIARRLERAAQTLEQR